jgi:hypothetical protein
MTWNTDNSRDASRPATAITIIKVNQPAIQAAARGTDPLGAGYITWRVAHGPMV